MPGGSLGSTGNADWRFTDPQGLLFHPYSDLRIAVGGVQAVSSGVRGVMLFALREAAQNLDDGPG